MTEQIVAFLSSANARNTVCSGYEYQATGLFWPRHTRAMINGNL